MSAQIWQIHTVQIDAVASQADATFRPTQISQLDNLLTHSRQAESRMPTRRSLLPQREPLEVLQARPALQCEWSDGGTVT